MLVFTNLIAAMFDIYNSTANTVPNSQNSEYVKCNFFIAQKTIKSVKFRYTGVRFYYS